ncbi:hypothetical protein DRN62_01625 [Nanoarchaeota archaeon]|nr:MAG: hypothetical protein DRN62_01625 [Nanoarchaeota archaeon]
MEVDKKTLEFLLKTSNEMLEEKKEKTSWISLASLIYGLMAVKETYSPDRFLYDFPLHTLLGMLSVLHAFYAIGSYLEYRRDKKMLEKLLKTRRKSKAAPEN